jgi:hypothetical protein
VYALALLLRLPLRFARLLQFQRSNCIAVPIFFLPFCATTPRSMRLREALSKPKQKQVKEFAKVE